MAKVPISFRTGVVFTLLAATLEVNLIQAVAPEYRPHERTVTAILYLLAPNFLLFMCYRWYVFPRFLSPYRNLPGPKDSFFPWGNAFAQIAKPPGQKMLNWVNDVPNDGLIVFRHFGEHRLIPTSAAALKSVLSENVYDWQKPEPVIAFLARILGLGLILAEGDLHKHQRKHLLPAFNIKVIRELYPLFWHKGRQMVDAIRDECSKPGTTEIRRMEFNDWTTRCTLDIIGIAGFGRDFQAVSNNREELVEAYEELLEPTPSNAAYFAGNVFLSPALINTVMINKEWKLRNVTRVLRKYSIDLVRARREQLKGSSDESRVDILSQIVRSDVFSDEEIVDQILTMLAAGHETTSSALTWVAYLLAIHPKIQDRLREEIRGHIGSLNDEVDSQLIESMPFLNAVCSETLRLYPTVPITIRESIRDTTIGDVPITKGTGLMLVPWAINRSKHFWGDDAEKFNPDRWMQQGTSKTGGANTNFATITFLHGSRSCIGRDFAQSELKCLVAAFIGRYKVELDMPESEVFPAGVVTTKPKNGMYLKLNPIEGW